MENFGTRLKEERERLGLGSTKFAGACGVGRTAQFNYERGEREPDSKYLEAATRIGVDVGYVLSGKRQDQRLKDSIEEELGDFGRAFVSILGIAEADLVQAAETVESRMKEHNAVLERSGMANFQKWREAREGEILRVVAPLVDNSPKLREATINQIDMGMLAVVIEQVEALLPGDAAIPGAKKAGVIAMLCRAFKASGKIDEAMVKEAVKLVAD